MKKFLSIALAAVLTLSVFAGCGSSSSSSAPEESSSASQSSEASASSEDAASGSGNNEKLIVGLDDQFPPMGFRDENNELVGFDIDLAKAVGEKLGMEVELTPIDWTTKELELNGDKVNLLWNGLTITPERQETMLMSPAYIANAQVVLVQADSGITTLADLSGKTVGLQDTSSADAAFAATDVAASCEVIKAAENTSLLNDLKIGRLDAVVIDKVVADYYLAQEGNEGLVQLEEQLADEEYGIAFKKGNDELADKVLTALQELVDDGTAAEISQKWFGEDRLIFQYGE
ncbi:MAG TPA: amino acid ABC transporter substrate-binding protein [Firmicutes bacterium]|nr:amino acid ABC transporter substrate-binding protein [Bacillota bacterium]